MNRTDRLLAIVLELQGKGRQRAEDLARTFETSKRTIYRDIQALCESGVPLVSIPGLGYSLMEGYFLPPLSFTTEEATMLLLGSDFMAQNFDAQYCTAAQSANRKIEGILPEQLRDDVRYLQSSIRFVATGPAHNPQEQAKLQQLRRAIIERTTVHFCYYKRHNPDHTEEQTSREADPYALIYMLNSWYLTAYCHLRLDVRIFRLDRMDMLVLLPKTFQRPANFQVGIPPKEEMSHHLLVRILFNPAIARWVRESRSFYTISEEEVPDGLLVTLAIRDEQDILPWLLSWGRHARILEPASLRERVAAEAKDILHNCQS